MKFVLYNDFTPGILQDDQLYDISAVLDPLGAHSPQKMVQMMMPSAVTPPSDPPENQQTEECLA